MRFFVFEYFSGGGSASQSVSNSILCEGYAMLNSILTDFNKTEHEIVSSLDFRIKRFDPLVFADETIEISNKHNFNIKFNEILSNNIDAVFLVAPETEGILYNLVKSAEKKNIPILGPSAAAVNITTNKYKTMQKIENVAKIPKTKVFSRDTLTKEIFQASKDIGMPFIMKPLDGVACAGISLIQNKDQIPLAIKKIKNESHEENFIIQEYIKGVDASISLLIGKNSIIPLPLNYQNIDLQRSTYLGGYTPFNHPLEKEIVDYSKKIIKNIAGLKGYIGIDYVITPEEAYFMEINPRLTTSYVGIREISTHNIAKAIIDLIIFNGKNLPKFKFNGYSHFSKVNLSIPNLTMKDFKKKYFKKGIIAPPFVIKGKEKEMTSAFICSHQENLNDSKKQIYNIKHKLLVGE